MKCYTITPIAPPAEGKKINEGILREWSYCNHHMVPRTVHDNKAYDKASDLDIADRHISIKASKFTLMSGTMCEGRTTFDGIWELFASRVHSNIFAYITADYTVYEMDLVEFKKFVYAFCALDRDSKKNGGRVKIKAHAESGKMLSWLASQVNA